jgi:hypothetical protein
MPACFFPMRKLLLACAALLAVVAVATAVAATRFDPEGLARLALAGAGARSGMRIDAGDISWTRNTGLVLGDVTLAGGFPAARVEIKAPQITIEHALWPLLRNRLDIDRVVIEGAHIEVRQRRPPPKPAAGDRPSRGGGGKPAPKRPPPAGAKAPERSPRVALAEIVIRESTLRLHDSGGSRRLLVVGLQGGLRDIHISPEGPSDLRRVTGEGELSLERLDADNLSIESVATSFHVAEGQLHLDGLRARHETGSLVDGSGRVGLAGRRGTFSFDVRLEEIDVDRLLATDRSAGGTAPARLELRGSGFLDRPRRVKAEGTLALGAGTLPPLPALASIDETVGTRLDGARYEASELSFERLPSGRIELAPLELVADSFVLRAQGALKPDRNLAVDAAVGLSPSDVQQSSLAETALELLTTEGERQWVPLRITGPLDEPRTAIDSRRARIELEQAARRQLEQHSDEIKETLGDELGDKLVREVEKLLDRPD